jgi:hypothetical protein
MNEGAFGTKPLASETVSSGRVCCEPERGFSPHPESAKALAVWIQTHQDPVREEVLTSRAGALATADGEVAVALAAKLVLASLPAPAEPFARAATSLDSDSPHGWLLLYRIPAIPYHEG